MSQNFIYQTSRKWEPKVFAIWLHNAESSCYRFVPLMKTIMKEFRFYTPFFTEAWRNFSPCLSSNIWNRNNTEDKLSQQNFLVDHFSYEPKNLLPPSESISRKLSVKHIVACRWNFFFSHPPATFSRKHYEERQNLRNENHS